MIAALALALLQAASPPAVSWTVRPESVTVAEPFTVTVVVTAPRGVTVTFPSGPDSSQAVEALDPPSISEGETSAGVTVRRAFYRLAAWNTGTLPVPFAPVVIGDGTAARRVDFRPVILVASVLPADSALRVPRPALGVIDAARPWWPWALGVALLLAAAALLRRTLRRRREAVPPPSALATAERALARVEALGLLDAGEPSRYVMLHAGALRAYLSARVAKVSRSQTTSEIVAALRGRALPLERVAAVLGEADQVQFARRAVDAARAKEIGREVRALLMVCDESFARDVPPAAVPAAPKRVA